MRNFLATLACVISTTSFGAVLTGADLLASARSTFPSGQHSLDGSSLVLRTINPNAYEVLLSYQAIAALPQVGDIAIAASINSTRIVEDSDPFFLLGNSSRLFGIVWSDDGLVQPNAGAIAVVSLFNGGTIASGLAVFDDIHNLGFPLPGGADSVDLSIHISDSAITVIGTYEGQTTSHTFTEAFDRSTGLSFFVVGDNGGGEVYGINSLTIAAVPEPATSLLFGFGLLAIWRVRRWRSS